MGLVITSTGRKFWSDAPSWSYTGFAVFRAKLARLFGYELWENEFVSNLGVGPVSPMENSNVAIKKAVLRFVRHSDCEGVMGSGLKELERGLMIVKNFECFDEYEAEQIKLLIKVIRFALKYKQKLSWE